MGQEEQLLAGQIRQGFTDARASMIRLGNLQAYSSIEELEDSGSDPAVEAEVLAYYIDRLFRDISVLGERMGVPLFCRELRHARANLNAPLSQVERDDEGETFSEALRLARRYYDSLAGMVEGSGTTGLSVFQSILENTSAIIANENLSPSSEKAIEKAIYKIIRYAFHDAVSQPTINKTLKNYKPEFGVTSLMAVAEYKFAHDLTGVRVALDGFYADMLGYAGDWRWRNFYAVLYTTNPILHANDLIAEFRLSKAGLEWTPILVHGPGSNLSNKMSQQKKSPQKAPREKT